MTDTISRAEVLKVLREKAKHYYGELRGEYIGLMEAADAIERMPSVGESDGKERLNQPG